MNCGRLDEHPGHWVTTRTVLGAKKRWCDGPPKVEGGNPARKGRLWGSGVTTSASGKRSKW